MTKPRRMKVHNLLEQMEIKYGEMVTEPFRPGIFAVGTIDAPPDVNDFRAPWRVNISITVRTQTIREGQLKEPDIMHAQRVLAHQLYGDVIAELSQLDREMWEAGVRTESPPMQRLARLMRALAGEPYEG